MKIVSQVNSASNLALPASPGTPAPSPKITQPFEKVLEQVRKGLADMLGNGSGGGSQLLDKLGSKGFKISPQELIVYQVRAGQFGLRVELLSKLAESAMSSIRKFQNPG